MNASARVKGKTLVVYYSVSGNTARVARDLARALGADIESLQEKRHGTGFMGYIGAVIDAVRGTPTDIGEPVSDPRNYSLVIVGTPVWAWNMTPAVRAWIQKSQPRLGDVAFFVTSGDTDAEKIVPSMEALAGHKAVASTGFNARQLVDRAVYDKRLAEFLAALDGRPHVTIPQQPAVSTP
jgi:flavodoxin